ncbi:MAG: hypothetical protein R2932_57885 [Caldilineaceae bacterium]
MANLSRYVGLWRFAFKRLWSEPALSLSLLCGWILVVALTAALPMYTDAVNRAQLQQELQGSELRNRPAFTFFYHFTGSSTGGTDWEHYQALRNYMAGPIADELRLAVQGGVHYAKSDILQVFPMVGGTYTMGRDQPLLRGYLGFVEGLEEHIRLVDGQFPAVGTAAPFEVLIHQKLATDTGLQVGEQLMLFDPSARSPTGGRMRLEIPIRVAGIWTADTDDPNFWAISPNSFANVFLTPEATYIGGITGAVPHALFDLGWYKIFDGGSVRSEDVGQFLRRMAAVNAQIQQRLPNTYLEFSPVAALRVINRRHQPRRFYSCSLAFRYWG